MTKPGVLSKPTHSKELQTHMGAGYPIFIQTLSSDLPSELST